MNPLIFRKGVCDPHIHIFEGKAFLYATHDAPGFTDGFCMQDWQIWSSTDLIGWELETTIQPKEFYCGSIDQCWALDAAYKEGKYYLYFSTGDWGVGVAVSDRPQGPFKDALGHALADYNTYPENIQKWDPHVFQDEDGAAYLIVGTCLQAEPWDCYLIARLQDDMIHLAEPFRRVEYYGNPCPEDKPSIHKYNGIYYLTHASYYAVSDNVYGPYIHKGHIGFTNDHGSFFTYHNQTYFAAGGMDNPNRYFRASYLVPCHYRNNGEIVIEQEIAAYGCGQYDAAWEKIQAKWYFGSSRECKVEAEDGSILVELREGEYLYFPEILNIEENTKMQIYAACKETAEIMIFEDSLKGEMLGSCTLTGNPDMKEQVYECCLNCSAGKKSLYLKMLGQAQLSGFSFNNGKKRYTAQLIFSKRGRGTCLTADKTGGNHQALKNLELRGAGFEVWMDGGAGGEACLTVDYRCKKKKCEMFLYINGEKKELVEFDTIESHLLEDVIQKSIKRYIQPGLNKIGFWTESYQEGELEITGISLETDTSSCKTYPAACGKIYPEGNGCWDKLPQWETEPLAYSGRIVKYLDKPDYALVISNVDGGEGGTYGLKVHYCCGESKGSEYELLINKKSLGRFIFVCTGGYQPEQMVDFDIQIVLEKGKLNEITLRKTGNIDRGIYVDAFSVIPVK